MSGDVQPRKRRDKKRKKDEGEEITTHQHVPRAATPLSTSDDINIHVHKDSGTGGGICAKLVFFVLLGALAVLIGLIITEHRGLTDLDTIQTETRFSEIFEGWVDKSPADDHEDDHHEVIESHEEGHDDEDGDHGNAHEDEEEDEEHENSEAVASHEEEEEETSAHDEEEEEEEEEEESALQEEDEEEEQSEQRDEEDEEQSEQQDDEVSEQDETEQSEEVEQSKELSEQDEEEEEEEAEQSKELSEQDEEEEEEEEEEQQSKELSEQDEEEEEEQKSEQDEEEEHSAEKEQSAEEEQVQNDEPIEEEEEEHADKSGEIQGEAEAEQDEEAVADAEDLSHTAVAVKVGVGVSILVVAYVVLIRKWKSSDETSNDATEKVALSRRHTIVIPPKVEEVEQVIDNDEEDYSEEDEIEDEVNLPVDVKRNYQQLRSTYAHLLEPESDTEQRDEYSDEDEVDEEEDVEEAGADVEYEEDEEEEATSEPDDEDLMKKLEEKYGRLQDDDGDVEEEEEEEEEYEGEEEEEEEGEEDDRKDWKHPKAGAQAWDSDDERDSWLSHSSGPQAVYEFENITNDSDYEVREQLDEAQQQIVDNPELAVHLFNTILDTTPESPRALYGKARVFDVLAEQRKSNELLKQSVAFYLKVLGAVNVPAVLYSLAADRAINRMRFVGQYGRAVNVHKLLIERFPNVLEYRNQLAVTFLTINRISEARTTLQEILRSWPNDGFALVHYGFILKVNDNKLELGVEYLKKGLATGDKGVTDGRFYFHLGDALTRLGRLDEAKKIYKDGVKRGVFLSEHQRSLYNVDRLKGRPWWSKQQTPQYSKFYDLLEGNFQRIRDEGLAVLSKKGYFQDEAENLRESGDWKQLELYARGVKNKENCKRCPVTCKIVETLPDAVGCRRGQIKFSVMHPGTHVWPHCGPTNCRLRVHLGLKVPPKTYIRVAEEIRSWEEGKVIIFDDGFEHEVWHNGSEFRLVLIVDVWHPDLTVSEKRSLSAI